VAFGQRTTLVDMIASQKFKKKAIRIVNFSKINYQKAHSDRFEHTAPLFSKYNILNVQKSSIYNIAIIMHKIWTNTLAKTTTIYDIIKRQKTGRKSNFLIPFVRTNTGKQSFAYSAPRIWNLLPADIKNCYSTAIFKKTCKKYLIQAQPSQINNLFWTSNKTVVFN
jgi:hypothetical protein